MFNNLSTRAFGFHYDCTHHFEIRVRTIGTADVPASPGKVLHLHTR